MEDAVKYIIFLVDADRLFDTALGMYDFSLVWMIAQHAQKVTLLGIMLLRSNLGSMNINRIQENTCRSCASYVRWKNSIRGLKSMII